MTPSDKGIRYGMEPARIHKFVSYAFAENFELGRIAGNLEAAPALTGPKDAVTRTEKSGGGVFAYNFGALTFWNVPRAERESEIKHLSERMPLTEKAVSEDFQVVEAPQEKPRVEFNRLILDELTPERAEVVAMTLAQSAAMEYYERLVKESWEKVANLVHGLETKGRVAFGPKRLHRIIGESITIRGEIVGILHLLDKPDLIWDDVTMDSLYEDLRTVFDLQERFQALEYKLRLIQESLELLVDIVRDRRIVFLEASIVFLILGDIILGVWR